MKKFIIRITLVAVLLGLASFIAYNTTSGQDLLLKQGLKVAMARSPDSIEGLRVVVCGSASPLGNDPERAQACIAVITPEHFFVFDVGARSPMRINQAGLPLNRLSGVFLTHYHSDHIAGLPDINLASWVQGRKESLRVYGATGIEKVITGFNLAYQLDQKYRVDHHGTDLLPPTAGPMRSMLINVGEIVWQDNLLTITSFLVDHQPISPAVGYRIDYRGRSVVISGDTNSVDALFSAAENADLLFHDALSRTLLDPMIATAREQGAPVLPTIMTDVIDYHADSFSIEARALQAGVRQLVYYHLVPVPSNPLMEKMFARGLSPDTILARDLQIFDLPSDSSEINITSP